jgi:hypothetical protein
MKARRSIALLCLVFVAAACAKPQTLWQPVSAAYSIDFREHTSDGFLLTPNPYMGEHRALGMVSVALQAGAELRRDRYGYERWHVIEVSLDVALAQAKGYAKELGGDGIANLDIRSSSRTVGAGYRQLQVPGWEIRGLAIKRN